MRRISQLTDAGLKAAIRAAVPRDIYDPAFMGLQLRITPQATTWYYRYRWQGKRVRATLGSYPAMPLAEARAAALVASEHRKNGIDPRAAGLNAAAAGDAPSPIDPAAPVHSIEALARDFLKRSKRKRVDEIRRFVIKDIVLPWTGRDARTITRPEVIALLDRIVDRGAPVMANRVKDVLGQMFEHGMDRGIVDTNPVGRRYRPGDREKPRSRALTDAEIRTLILNLKPVFRSKQVQHALPLLLLTMQRRGELMAARWSDIDWSKKTWRIPDENAKTGKGHVVPLSEWALAEFAELKQLAGASPFVFPRAKGAPTHSRPALVTLCLWRCQNRLRALGVGQFTVHDLRRTGRTGLAKLKVKRHTAERVLNHVQETIEGTYDVHDYAKEKRAALEKWSAYLRKLVYISGKTS